MAHRPTSNSLAERRLDNHHFLGTNPKWLCSLGLLAALTAGAQEEILFPAPSLCLHFPREKSKDFLIRIQKKKTHNTINFFKSFSLELSTVCDFFFAGIKKVILSLRALSIQ